MNVAIRGLVVWALGTVVVLGLFMFISSTGWSGQPHSCVYDSPDTCFCEAFEIAEVEAGTPGVRQPVNTWSNLYALLTSLLIAVTLYRDRKKRGNGMPKNMMFSDLWLPDLYVFAVLFLGLGSMWFHGSLTGWGNVLDGFSMYFFVSFLVMYTMRRIWPSNLLFWGGYVALVGLFTFLHTLLPAVVNIVVLTGLYLLAEMVVGFKTKTILLNTTDAHWYWGLAIAAMAAATFFWWASQTGNFMCGPDSFFQPHGLLWHPLAGLAAVLLYFYWREEEHV